MHVVARGTAVVHKQPLARWRCPMGSVGGSSRSMRLMGQSILGVRPLEPCSSALGSRFWGGQPLLGRFCHRTSQSKEFSLKI